ncbi:MAG: Rieske (2Fe-2S) protein [Acidimicrobiales bacterium]
MSGSRATSAAHAWSRWSTSTRSGSPSPPSSPTLASSPSDTGAHRRRPPLRARRRGPFSRAEAWGPCHTASCPTTRSIQPHEPRPATRRRRPAPGPDATWHKLLELDELDDGRVTTVSVGTRSFAVSRFEGRFGCLDNACPHQRAPGRGLDRAWLAALPVARLRLLPTDGRPPEGFNDAPALNNSEPAKTSKEQRAAH